MDLGMVENKGDTGGTGFLADKAVPAVLRSLEGAKAPPGEWDWLERQTTWWRGGGDRGGVKGVGSRGTAFLRPGDGEGCGRVLRFPTWDGAGRLEGAGMPL